MDETVITLVPGLLVTIATFSLGTIANSYIIFKILQKPRCFLNYSLELNISFLGLVVCFFIALLRITENVLSLTTSVKYPEICAIKWSCSSGLQVSLMVNLMVLSYRRSKKIRTIDSSQSIQARTGVISVIICWLIGLLVTIICLTIIFSQPLTSDNISQGCEFLNNDSIYLINCLLFLTFFISVLIITIINIKIVRFIRKPAVFPLSAISPSSLPQPNSSSSNAVSSLVIHTKQLMEIPDPSTILTQPDLPICSINKYSCSSISSSIYVDSRARPVIDGLENSSRPHSNSISICSSAKEDDNESDDESIFSISNKSNPSFVSNQIQLHNGILSQLNNTVNVERTKIKLCNDISKLTNCEFKQNFISTVHSPVSLSTEEWFNKNNQNVLFVSERLGSLSSVNPIGLSEYSAYNSLEDERYIYQNNFQYKNNSFHSNSDDSDVQKSDLDRDSDSDSNNVSLGDVVDHNLICSEVDCESDQHEDCSDWELPEYKKCILSRPRLQPVPMKKGNKRKLNSNNNYRALSHQLPSSNLSRSNMSPEMNLSHSNLSPAMNLSCSNMSPARKMNCSNMSPARKMSCSSMSPALNLSHGNMSPAMNFSRGNLSPAMNFRCSNLSPAMNLSHGNMSPAMNLSHGNMSPAMNFSCGNLSPAMNFSRGNLSPAMNLSHGNMSPAMNFSRGNLSPAMNLSRRKAIVNFNYTQLPVGQSPINPENRKIIFPPRSNWNRNMNMPVMLTRRHRMKRIVFHNLLLELLVFIFCMISPYIKNIISYDYTELDVIVKSFLYLTETLRLLLFAINPFLYIIKNKNIMNDLL